MSATWNVGQTGKKAGTFDVDVEVKRTVTVRIEADSRTAAGTQAQEAALANRSNDKRITTRGEYVANVLETREAGW